MNGANLSRDGGRLAHDGALKSVVVVTIFHDSIFSNPHFLGFCFCLFSKQQLRATYMGHGFTGCFFLFGVLLNKGISDNWIWLGRFSLLGLSVLWRSKSSKLKNQ